MPGVVFQKSHDPPLRRKRGSTPIRRRGGVDASWDIAACNWTPDHQDAHDSDGLTEGGRANPEIAAAMTDPAVEKITVQKSARIGFSTLLSSLIAYHFTEKPAPVLLVLPAEADAPNAVVALEEIFDCSPALRGRAAGCRIRRSVTRTVHSQLMGGMIWGISSEATEIDKEHARYVNDNLARRRQVCD